MWYPVRNCQEFWSTVKNMRSSRLLAILLLLQARGRATAQKLAETFEVSERTIYRDIDALSAAGVPVYADRGPGGGFALLEGYRTTLTGLTEPEAQTLLLAGFPQAIEAAGLSASAATAQLKLHNALPDRLDGQHLAQRMHLDPVGWYRRADDTENLVRATTATLSGRKLRIDYESWSGRIERVLDPLGLVLKAGTWYLVAAVAGSPRTYRVASIRSAHLLDEDAERPSGFSLAGYWAAYCETFERGLARASARIRVSESVMHRVNMLGSAVEDAIRAAPPDEEGWRSAEVPIESVDHAASLFMLLAPCIVVLAPGELRSRMHRIALETANLNAGAGPIAPD